MSSSRRPCCLEPVPLHCWGNWLAHTASSPPWSNMCVPVHSDLVINSLWRLSSMTLISLFFCVILVHPGVCKPARCTARTLWEAGESYVPCLCLCLLVLLILSLSIVFFLCVCRSNCLAPISHLSATLSSHTHRYSFWVFPGNNNFSLTWGCWCFKNDTFSLSEWRIQRWRCRWQEEKEKEGWSQHRCLCKDIYNYVIIMFNEIDLQ